MKNLSLSTYVFSIAIAVLLNSGVAFARFEYPLHTLTVPISGVDDQLTTFDIPTSSIPFVPTLVYLDTCTGSNFNSAYIDGSLTVNCNDSAGDVPVYTTSTHSVQASSGSTDWSGNLVFLGYSPNDQATVSLGNSNELLDLYNSSNVLVVYLIAFMSLLIISLTAGSIYLVVKKIFRHK